MQNIQPWTDYILSLSEEKFFYLMRLYLGEIKTPFNKVKLVSQLASFLRSKESLENILTFLDETDIEFLTAVKYLPSLSVQTLVSFFSDEYSESFIYTRAANLKDRLLVYTEKNDSGTEEYFRLNPLLEDELSEYLDPETILPEAEISEVSFDTPFSLSPNFLASFISYININGCSLKADGKFKKTDLANLETIFGDRLECLQLLITAFVNLSLVREGEKSLLIDAKHFEIFASLPEFSQYLILATASAVKLSRDSMKRQTQILADCLASVPEGGCTRSYFIRLSRLISQRGSLVSKGPSGGVSRFSKLLNMAKNDSSASFDSANVMESVFESVCQFGLLRIKGINEKGENIYVTGESTDNVYTDSQNSPKVLSINGASSVMLLPGLSLKNLLPLTNFLQIISSSTVTEFEISKKSVSKAFDRGMSLEKVQRLLSDNATFELPQNLLINLEEWHNSYASAILYKGFVLKVSASNITRVENNPSLSGFISEKLAEGIYLLKLPLDSDPTAFLKASGLDFMGSVKSVEKENEVFVFPSISGGHDCSIKIPEEKEFKISSVSDAIKTKEALLKKLESLSFGEMQKENLQNKIENNLIVSEAQLESTAFRTEILEADAMDFHGKIHLVEASIKNHDMLEVFIASGPNGNETSSLFGSPVQLIKHEGEAILKLLTEPDHETVTIFISKVSHIKRIRS